MISNLYSVLDTKTGSFMNPIPELTDGSAIRKFTDYVNENRPDNQWYHHPEDFALYYIGSFDTATAELIPAKVIKCLVTASAIKKVVVEKQMELFKNDVEKTPVLS